jgi:hypothetical protein
MLDLYNDDDEEFWAEREQDMTMPDGPMMEIWVEKEAVRVVVQYAQRYVGNYSTHPDEVRKIKAAIAEVNRAVEEAWEDPL